MKAPAWTKRQRNGTVYTGLVGAKLRQRKHSISRRVVKRPVHLVGGPLSGCSVWLEAAHPFTLPIVVRGMAGHYGCGVWIKHKETA